MADRARLGSSTLPPSNHAKFRADSAEGRSSSTRRKFEEENFSWREKGLPKQICTAKVFIVKTCRARAAKGLPMQTSTMGNLAKRNWTHKRRKRTTATGDHPQSIRHTMPIDTNRDRIGRAPNAPTVDQGSVDSAVLAWRWVPCH